MTASRLIIGPDGGNKVQPRRRALVSPRTCATTTPSTPAILRAVAAGDEAAADAAGEAHIAGGKRRFQTTRSGTPQHAAKKGDTKDDTHQHDRPPRPARGNGGVWRGALRAG
jgi:hypothetical protein